MTEKICKHCAMKIPKAAKVCPYCRKRQGMSYGAGCLLVIAAGLLIIIMPAYYKKTHPKNVMVPAGELVGAGFKPAPTLAINDTVKLPGIPEYQIIAKFDSAINILIPPKTGQEQLKALIQEFRKAKAGNYLDRRIPATTRGGELGDYAIVWIFIFDDSKWTDFDKLNRFIKSSLKSVVDQKFDKEYIKHIKGEYYYSGLEEYGNLGYYDGINKSANYKKLF